MKILLVDDDQELTSFLSMELEDMGHFIEVANDGISGKDLALKKPYDVIILDLMLPGTDGHSICRNLRENHVITPVLMISSLNSNKEIQAGTNPCDPDDYPANYWWILILLIIL